MNQSQAALSYVLKAIELSPTVPEYWFICGDIQVKLARYEEGIASYRKVIELDPEDPDIWLDLSVVYADRKDFHQAITVLEEGLKWHEENADFHYGMAYYHLMAGKPKESLRILNTALSMDYDGHKRLFMTFPEARNHPIVLDLIASFKKE